MRAQLRDRLQQQQAGRRGARIFISSTISRSGAMLSRYIWFGLVSALRRTSSLISAAMNSRPK